MGLDTIRLLGHVHPLRPADHHLPAQELLEAVMDGMSAFAGGKVQFMRNDCWELTELSLLYLHYTRMK